MSRRTSGKQCRTLPSKLMLAEAGLIPEMQLEAPLFLRQVSPENSVPAFLEIEDLKRKVARLIEQVGEHAQDTSTLKPLSADSSS